MTIGDWAAGGREVAVLGLGRSGLAATRLLLSRGIAVYASDVDTSDVVETRAAEARKDGAVVDVGEHDLSRIMRAAAVVLSPGIPPDAPPLAAARQAGVPVRAEIDVGLEAIDGVPYVGVTGTNGKSTTTALVAHLLSTSGARAEAAGNIGIPLTDVALRPDRPDWLAIEFSSFQLHDTPLVAPQAGILTNVTPDHLDRYESMDSYRQDKRLFFRNATPESIWVTNLDDVGSVDVSGGVLGTSVRFSIREHAEGWWDRDQDVLVVDDTPILPREELGLIGDHNVANALAAALAVRRVAGVAPVVLADGLRSFTALPHRLEIIGEIRGVVWINDSKATNLASTEVAVAALRRPFILLLGGRHKGEAYARLLPLLESQCVAVVAYGEAGPLIASDLGDAVRIERADHLEQAVSRAALIAVPGDTVVLSPACSSYDMFRNYEQRGAHFRELVAAM